MSSFNKQGVATEQSKSVTKTLLILFLVVSGFLALFVLHHISQKAPQPRYGTFVQPARDLTPFNLIGIDGQPFTNRQTQGQWTWIFFGFTQCASICPTTMAKLAKAYQLLEKKGGAPLPSVVMITLDPARDTGAQLKSYVRAFDSHFYGATGELGEVNRLAAAFGIAHEKVPTDKARPTQGYAIEHSGAVILLNPKGQLQGFYNPPFSAEQLAEDHQRYSALSKN